VCTRTSSQWPERIRRGAHVTGGGELLWPRGEAVEAARWLAAHDLAIWGGEVYAARGPFTAAMVSEWRTAPDRAPDEPWPAYVRRSLEQALDAIAGEGATRPLFFLAYHSRAGFPAPTQEGCR
jgi:hypothetical protein